MNPTAKYIINAVLLTFVVIALGYGLLGRTRTAEAPDAFQPRDSLVPAVDGVDPEFAVYFFYNDVYCETCDKLEGYALEAVRSDFADELESGKIQWRSLDMTTPENSHYPEDFKLYSKSVVLVEFDGTEEVHWENLEEIWDLVHDEEAYKAYISESLRAFMDPADE